MIRALSGLLLVLSLVAGFACFGVYKLRQEAKTAQEVVSQLTESLAVERKLRQADQRALVKQATLRAEVRADERKSNAQLQEALRSESVWADQLVPAGVADAFRVPSSTKH